MGKRAGKSRFRGGQVRVERRRRHLRLDDDEIKIFTAYEVSISKLCAYESAENFDVDEEFSGNVRFVGEEEGEMLFVER